MAQWLLTRLSVTLKVETVAEKDGTVIKLIGWIRAEYLPELEAKTRTSSRRVALEMAEVTMVDVEAERLSTGALCRAEVPLHKFATEFFTSS